MALSPQLFRIAAALAVFLAIPAAASEPWPRFLLDLDRAYRAGDWVLQCDSSRICRILGVVRHKGGDADARAVVIISRGIEANARYYLSLAFIDDEGFSLPAPQDEIRFGAPGRNLRTIPLTLGEPIGDPAYPLYRAAPDSGWRIVAALRSARGMELRRSAGLVSRLPRGDLDALLRRMDELQSPLSAHLGPDEESRWMQEYNYSVVRAHPPEVLAAPDAVLNACTGEHRIIRHETWQLDPANLLHIAHCPEGGYTFLQTRPAPQGPMLQAYAPPIQIDVLGPDGAKRPAQAVSFDPASSILELTMTQNGRWDCGLRLQYAWTDRAAFGVIEDRRMPMCRNIPPAYWLVAWKPTSWRYAD